MGGNSGKADIARDYRKRHGSKMPTLKLARMMYKENKLQFKDVEDARDKLRYIEGKKGDSRLSSKVSESEFYSTEARPTNPYNLPKSDETIYEPYVIKGHSRIGVLSDIHIPYHNIDALTAAISFLKKEKIDALLLNGDVIDCHQLSRFVRDPTKRKFSDELETFKAVFNIFQKQFNCQIYFKLGNHEERYENFLFEKAKELNGVKEVEFDSIIQARANGIKMIADKRYMVLNELHGIHGHEYVGGISAPVNPARGLFLKSKVSCFQGHNHQTSEHTEPTMTGRMVTTWSLGCLSELHPRYMPLNKWNHGFAVVDLDSNKRDFEVRNKRILNGKVL